MNVALTKEGRNKLALKPVVYGFCGGVGLLLVYFFLLSFANSFGHAVDEFVGLWYWILLLIFGFGIQIGLYVYVREFVRIQHEHNPSSSMLVTSGGVSTVSMAACCVHHLSDILPLIGLSVFAVFLNKFQIFFILLGVFFNVFGIAMMLRIIQRHNYYFAERGFLRYVMCLNFGKAVYAVFGGALLILSTVFYYSLTRVS